MDERRQERIEINSKLTESAYDALPLCLSYPRPPLPSYMLSSANYQELESSFTPVVSGCLSLICQGPS